MKFSNGLFDSLFGEKMTIEVRQDDGTLREVKVTKAWWKKNQAEGNVTVSDVPPNVVHLHIVGPDGLEQSSATIGKDISENDYKRLVDPKTGALYAMKMYRSGKAEINFVPKKLFEDAKRAMGAIG